MTKALSEQVRTSLDAATRHNPGDASPHLCQRS